MFASRSQSSTAGSPPFAVDMQRGALKDLFDAWVLAAHEAREALDVWGGSNGSSARRDAHAVYCAALDREEHAAHVLAAAAPLRRAAAVTIA
jgi:hypothetical protein